MAYNRREAITGNNVFVHITGVVANTGATQFTGKPFWFFWGYYYGSGTNAYVDLGFDSTSDGGVTPLVTTDLPFDVSTTAFDRLDYFSKSVDITFPKIAIDKKKYLGSEGVTGAQNSYLVQKEPDNVTVKLTLNGAVSDLMRLRAASVTAPTGYSRYNFGSKGNVTFGLALLSTTDPAAPTATTAVTIGYFINNCRVVDIGDLTKVDSSGEAEATFEIEGNASNFFGEVFNSQQGTTHNSTTNN